MSDETTSGATRHYSPPTSGMPVQPGSDRKISTSVPLPQDIDRYRVEKVLGVGGYGIVYLAHDAQLDRRVAVKVPHAELVSAPENAAAYLSEARTVAHLDHPGIVPVYDVGSTETFPCYVVLKYIEGTDLASVLGQRSFDYREAAELAATVADALNHAHQQGFVHRDVKPGNVLIGNDGRPYVVDFGLALREENIGKGPKYAGTPAYMSPEQARGEGHRVDRRSDIFSLGSVLYELLVGRKPFRGDTQAELLEQVTRHEPRPLRQFDVNLPRELERICHKAMSKRASDRYSSAQDMAEDLRQFLANHTPLQNGGPQDRIVSTSPSRPSTSGSPTGASGNSATAGSFRTDSRPIKIVPKGLRSFDSHDADFFLELLPGPRDRDGLPDSLRFWKTRIEETDSDDTFSVGLIYGPSGCGKSSLIKAGLLPRLSADVISVYIEATAEETETRLLHHLRKRCPAVGADLNLQETLAGLRQGLGIPAGRKLLIVLDQFEQWLHAKKEQEDAELVRALRQCDGGRVQCVVMVRDDFWMAATRLMRELEVRLVEAHNSAAVDLFPIRHAERVMAAFGRAFGVLPEDLSQTTEEQKSFIKQAVAGLSAEGKVICVRLALFVEMMKSRPWTPAALKQVGGTAGIGATFLEETFCSPTASPNHRLHQKAARAVLKALLPESGTDIKGEMNSYAELLEASGYARRPTDFDDLVRILDSELRLITPTESEEPSSDAPETGDGPASSQTEFESSTSTNVRRRLVSSRYYQLTHDYLVTPLRDWLTRKQKETRKGRAEITLSERAATWNNRPETRNLPSSWEYCRIRVLTSRRIWSEPERKMMSVAARRLAIKSAALLLLAALGLWMSLAGRGWFTEQQRATYAVGLVQRLLDAETEQVPTIVSEMADYHPWVGPLLREAKDRAAQGSRQELHACIALLPSDANHVDYLYNRLLSAEPREVPVITKALEPHKRSLSSRLWSAAESTSGSDEHQRLRAAAALTIYEPSNDKWADVSPRVANALVQVEPVFLGSWSEIFRPAKSFLIQPLAEVFRDRRTERLPERLSATNLLADYAADRPQFLVDLLLDADARQFAAVFPKVEKLQDRGRQLLASYVGQSPPPDCSEEEKFELARRKANAAVALLRLNDAASVWPLLKLSPDPLTRSYVIHRIAKMRVGPASVAEQWDKETDVSIRRALLLSLGEYEANQIPTDLSEFLTHKLLNVYRHNPDAGIHSAAAWTLRRWEQQKQLDAIDRSLATSRFKDDRRWYVTKTNQHTFAVVQGPVTLAMGSPKSEPGADTDEIRRQVRITRSFGVSMTEVTVAQFRAFEQEMRKVGHLDVSAYSPDPLCPQVRVDWYDAVRYCRWLSEREGIPEDQMCYPPIPEITEGMTPLPDYLQRTGYRLPSDAEWEYACQGMTATSRYYGDAEDLLGRYAWYIAQAEDRTWPVGTLKPNDLGLFDMLGNATEWVHDRYQSLDGESSATSLEELADLAAVENHTSRIIRGGAFDSRPGAVRSAHRDGSMPTDRDITGGFRIARTMPPKSGNTANGK